MERVYVCGCKDIGSSFVFCSTHALSSKKKEIDENWSNYSSRDWAHYKRDLVKGLELELA